MIATLIGVAVEQGKLDIDKPISEYGVPGDGANWSVFGTDISLLALPQCFFYVYNCN